MIYNAVSILSVQQCDSVIDTHTYILFRCGLSQGMKCSSLCSIIGPCCDSFSYCVCVCVCVCVCGGEGR